jgi:hypothetical protein
VCTGTVLARRRRSSEEAIDYLARVATDGTFKAAFCELVDNEHDLAD